MIEKKQINLDTGKKTQRQIMAILAIVKLRKWFDGLTTEEKINFSKEFPEFVTHEANRYRT